MKLKLALLVGTLSLSSFAQESSTTTAPAESANQSSAKINKGNVTLNSSAYFSTTTGPNSTNSANVTLEGEYFLVDHVSAGMGFLYSLSNGQSVSSVGPEATYYFWAADKLAAYLQGGIRFGLTNSTVRNFLFGTLGVNYFITPEVAIGPSLYFDRDNGHYTSWNKYGMAVNFSIHL